MRHLGLADWIEDRDHRRARSRRPVRDARHSPATACCGRSMPTSISPMLEQAEGGTLLTGVGGDELWMSLVTRCPGRPRRGRSSSRHSRFAARCSRGACSRSTFPWLRAEGRRAAMRAAGADAAASPRTVRRADGVGQGDALHGGRQRRARSARGRRGRRIAPSAARSRASGRRSPPRRRGAGSRAARRGARGRRGAAACPPSWSRGAPRPRFDAAFFDEHARAFAEDWDGRRRPGNDLDRRRGAARALGATETPDPHTLTAIQAAWLASAGRPRRGAGRRPRAVTPSPRAGEPQVRQAR